MVSHYILIILSTVPGDIMSFNVDSKSMPGTFILTWQVMDFCFPLTDECYPMILGSTELNCGFLYCIRKGTKQRLQ